MADLMYNNVEVTLPVAGDRLDNGAVVISYTHKHDGERGWLPNGIVLAMYQGGRRTTEFVTWNCAFSDSLNKWTCDLGHYYTSIIDAANDYADRGGK